MRTYPVSIFLPVYNFRPQQLMKNVAVVRDFLEKNYKRFEIVIIDDNADAETKTCLEEVAKLEHVRVTTYTNGPSKRENLATSLTDALYDILCFMDIDLSTELSHLPHLTDEVYKGHDVVVGSRYKGIQSTRKWYRHFVSKLYNAALFMLFSSNIADHTCGFKGFRKDAITTLIRDMGYDASKKRGWFWDAEMLIRAQRGDYRVVEIPVKWVGDEQSTFSFRDQISILSPLIKFRCSLNIEKSK